MTLFSVHCCEPSDVGAADGVDAVGSGQLSVCHPLGSKLLSSGCAAKGHLDSLLTLGVGQLSSRTFTKKEPGRVGRSFSQDCRKPCSLCEQVTVENCSLLESWNNLV